MGRDARMCVGAEIVYIRAAAMATGLKVLSWWMVNLQHIRSEHKQGEHGTTTKTHHSTSRHYPLPCPRRWSICQHHPAGRKSDTFPCVSPTPCAECPTGSDPCCAVGKSPSASRQEPRRALRIHAGGGEVCPRQAERRTAERRVSLLAHLYWPPVPSPCKPHRTVETHFVK